MSPIELKRMKLQMVQVAAAQAELEFKVEERLDEIERIKAAILVQKAKVEELSSKITSEETPV